MKGFKNTTRTQYSMGGDVYAKGGMAKGAAKISKVMGEFKKGELHSGSKDGPKVTKPAQAKAIAMSEARKAGMKAPMKKNEGGKIGKMPPLGESVKSGNRMSKMTAAERLAMEARFGEKKRPSPADSAKSANRIAKEEADEARHLGVFNKGGKVRKYAEGGVVEPVRKRPLPAFDASAVYQDFGRELKGLIDSGQLTLEQANALKGDAFQATRYRDVGQQQEAMKAALAGARGQMGSMLVTPPNGRVLSGLELEGLKNASIMKEKPPLMMELPTPPPMQKIYEPRRAPGMLPPTAQPQPYIDSRGRTHFPDGAVLADGPGTVPFPPMTPPPLQNLGQGLQRIQQRQRPGMDPVDPGFAIDRGGYDMTAPAAGMAPVDPNKAMMMKKGGRTAMPKGKR